MIAEVNNQTYEFICPAPLFDRQYGADANIDLFKIGKRGHWFNWRRLDFFVAHGFEPTSINPVFSSRPNIRFIFWTAWPAAPFTKLSSAEKTTTCRPRLANPRSQKLVVFTQLISGEPFTSRTKNDSR